MSYNTQSLNLFRFLCIVCAVVYVIVYILLSPGAFNKYLFDVCFLITFVLLIGFIIQSQKHELKHHWLKPSYFFVLAFLAVNFQFLLDYRLGLKDNQSSNVFYPLVFNQCTVLAATGFAAFVAGYFSLRSFPFRRHGYFATKHKLSLFISLLQLLVFALFVSNINLVTFLSGVDYGLADSSVSKMYYFENLLYVCNAVIIVLVANRNDISNLKGYINAFPTLSLIIIILYMIMRLVSGDRGPFIYTALLLLFGYLYSSRKIIKFSTVVVFLLSALLFISLIGIARSLDKTYSFSDRIAMAFDYFSENGRFNSEDRSVLSLTEELGYSFVVNQIDVNAVEVQGEPHHYGAYQLITIASSIPFVPGLIANVFHVRSEDFSSSGFANYHLFGGYERTYGIGTTILGDFYLDFGVIGVLFGLFLAGLLFCFLDASICYRPKEEIGIYLLLFIILFSAKAVYIPRSVLLIDLQGFVLGSIIIYVNSLLSKNK